MRNKECENVERRERTVDRFPRTNPSEGIVRVYLFSFIDGQIFDSTYIPRVYTMECFLRAYFEVWQLWVFVPTTRRLWLPAFSPRSKNSIGRQSTIKKLFFCLISFGQWSPPCRNKDYWKIRRSKNARRNGVVRVFIARHSGLGTTSCSAEIFQ